MATGRQDSWQPLNQNLHVHDRFLDLPPLLKRGRQGLLAPEHFNRVLLLAGLSEGTTVAHDLLASDDTRVMLEAPARTGL